MKIFLTAIILFIFIGCAPKSSNEISEMALECFKNHQGITIIFQPQPETKKAQEMAIEMIPDKVKK